jgi:DNA-binding transcriptional LysR family regulator
MSQPGVSMLIRRLEQHYRVPLVTRLGRRIVLTEAGSALYRHALTTLQSGHELDSNLRAIRRSGAGSVRFAGSQSAVNYLMPPILGSFLRQHSDAVVEMQYLDRSLTLEAALERGMDFVILLRRHAVVSPHLTIEPFRREPVVLVASPHHRLAQMAAPTLADLAREPFIYQSRGMERISLLEELVGKEADVHFRVLVKGNIEAVKRLVREGIGITAIVRFAVEEELARGELRLVEIPGLELSDDFILVYERESRFSRLAEALMDHIRQEGGAGREEECPYSGLALSPEMGSPDPSWSSRTR